MKKVKEIFVKLKDWKFIILIILIVGGAFYWFQIRPSIIYSSCQRTTKEFMKENLGSNWSDDIIIERYEFAYKTCLRSKGIIK